MGGEPKGEKLKAEIGKAEGGRIGEDVRRRLELFRESHLSKKTLGDVDERWVVNGRCVPDDRILSPKVAVSQDIAESRDGPPRNFRQWIGDFCGKMFDGLADDFEVAGYSVDSPSICRK